MGSNGWRGRYFYSSFRPILVLHCAGCRRYDRLLPADVCAYRDLTLGQWEAAIDAGPGHVAGARAAGQLGPGATRRVRRWHRGFALLVQVLLALLPAVAGPWLTRVRAVVGPRATVARGGGTPAGGAGSRLGGCLPLMRWAILAGRTSALPGGPVGFRRVASMPKARPRAGIAPPVRP